jgi:phosphoesterase RecJ-like protein
MSSYNSNADLSQIADQIRSADQLVLTTHAKPDGDAIGSVIALAEALATMGKKAECWIMPPLPKPLKFLTDGFKLHYHADDTNPLPSKEPDRIIILDTGSWAQLMPMKPWLEPRHDRISVVDHHLHGNDVGATIHTDPSAAATCQIVHALIQELGVEPTNRARHAMYVGLASDTGWFRFSNTTAPVLRMAADLIDAGVNHAELHTATEQGERPQKLALMQRALANLQFIADNRAAVMSLEAKDFSDTGARPEETERFVDLPQLVGSVQAVAMIIETKPGKLIRISFRSKPGPKAIDVNQLAQKFGGGGHARASGAKATGDLAEVIAQVSAALTEATAQD